MMVLQANGGPSAMGTNLRGDGFHSFHTGGCQLVMCDGAVKFVSENVSQAVFAGVCVRRAKSLASSKH